MAPPRRVASAAGLQLYYAGAGCDLVTGGGSRRPLRPNGSSQDDSKVKTSLTIGGKTVRDHSFSAAPSYPHNAALIWTVVAGPGHRPFLPMDTTPRKISVRSGRTTSKPFPMRKRFPPPTSA